MAPHSSLLDAALDYAEKGYKVFPCVPGGKRPAVANGFHAATDDPEQIELWWMQNPDYNIGLHCDGLAVIDVDGEDNTWPNDPDRSLELSRGVLQHTPRGGRHYIFRAPEGTAFPTSAGKLAPGVDTRGAGGYICVAPSVVDGKQYTLAETFESIQHLSTPPAWVMDAFETSGNSPTNGQGQRPGGFALPAVIGEGSRDATLTSYAGYMRRAGCPDDELFELLQVVNKNRCRPPLPDEDLMRIARSIGAKPYDVVTKAVLEGIEVPEDFWAKGSPEPPALTLEQLRMPGFVSELMDFSLEGAPYPNQALAFCGAAAFLAAVTGRKVTDRYDTRTNMYFIGLAHSGTGKQHPRDVNNQLAMQALFDDHLKDDIGSGPGLEDALRLANPLLVQSDEVAGLIRAIAASGRVHNPVAESIMDRLLKMYSSSRTTFRGRMLAGKEPVTIHAPHVVLFGTAIPNDFFAAMSVGMTTNGFLSRLFVVENTETRVINHEARGLNLPFPERVLEAANAWVALQKEDDPLKQAAGRVHPKLIGERGTPQAMIREAREYFDSLYNEAMSRADEGACTVWARAGETMLKLALLYACSENHRYPTLSNQAVAWAADVAYHSCARTLWLVHQHSAETDFEDEAKKVLRLIQVAPMRRISRSELLRKAKWKAKHLDEVVSTLIESERVAAVAVGDNGGRPSVVYTLLQSN